MENQILKFLNEQKGKRFDAKRLSEALDKTASEDFKALVKALNNLEDKAEIIPNKKNEYTLINYTSFVKGVLDVKDKGFAFLLIDDSDEEDIYIHKSKLKDAMNGDHVLVNVTKSPKGFRKEGKVERILKRNYTHLIGTVIKRGNQYVLISDDKAIKDDILIHESHLNGAGVHDKVQAKIINYDFDDQMVCKVIHVIGPMNQSGVDILSKILAHDIDPEFPSDVIEEAKQYKTLDVREMHNRKDLRDRTIFTIDGDDAKDFDDAIEIKRLENGNYHLGVHIADVSYYVKENSLLDKEAFNRATSIYLVDRVIPMLPENLSNNLCSLMPEVDRFAVSCEMEIDQHGKVKHHEIFPSVINSKARLTYKKVNKMLEGDESLLKEYAHIKPSIPLMQNLAKTLRDLRTQKGSLHFETDEPTILLDENGKARDVVLEERGESEKIIEECMLIANQTVAEHVFWLELPFIYRIHEAPKEEKLQKLLTMANALGFRVKGKKTIAHSELQKLLQKVENTASEKGINTMMLRSMQKAVYDAENLGHFGLAFKHYTHFTSPIRRYPDLMVHRLLRKYFFEKDQSDDTIKHYDSIMSEVASHTSKMERKAVMLERDVLDMKKAEYMAAYIGETFEGHVSSVTSFGIYVALDNTVEGLVHMSALDDDYYFFNEDLLMLVGKHKRKIYRMGDTVKITVDSVNIFDGQVDFVIAKGENNENHRKK